MIIYTSLMLINVKFNRFNELFKDVSLQPLSDSFKGSMHIASMNYPKYITPFQTRLKFAWRVLLWSAHRCPLMLSLTQSRTSVSLVYTPGASSSAHPSPQLTTPTRLDRMGYSVHLYSGECHLYWPPGSEDVTRGPPLSP